MRERLAGKRPPAALPLAGEAGEVEGQAPYLGPVAVGAGEQEFLVPAVGL